MLTQVREIFTDAGGRIMQGVENLLPGLLALAFMLLLAIVFGAIVRVMIRRSLRGIDFDQRIRQWGFSSMADWSPSGSPTLLVAGLAFWFIILVGLLVGVSALNIDLTSVLVLRFFEYLPNVLAAVLILIVGTLVSRFLARGVLISAVNMQIHSARLLSLGVKWLVMVVAGAMALEHLGIGGQIARMAFGILFGGIVLALALAVGLGSRDIVSRSLERQAGKAEEEPADDIHHL
jgi:hypothetical protein